jgi:hypothetical protein
MRIPAFLLSNPSACLRRLVLTELLHRPDDDPEVRELDRRLSEDPLVKALVELQEGDGSWGGRARVLFRSGERIRNTSLALTRLGYLGFGPDHPCVGRGAEYLFRRQRRDGSWPLVSRAEGYSMVPLQTAVPLRGIAACGFASDPRAENAYRWLLSQRLEDGAWPTGIASGSLGRVAGYRRLAHSRWGCRTNTTGALLCLALHPERRGSNEARRGLDLLMGRETREQFSLGFEVARLIGAEPIRGVFTLHARFDLALMLDLCRHLGADETDPRVADLIRFVEGLRGPNGLWEYPAKPQASHWVTFDLLRSLAAMDRGRDWFSIEPRTPFRPYPKRRPRY